MDRITIAFYPETFAKLTEGAAKKKTSIAHYVRELVDMGLKIEELSAKKDNEKPDKNAIETLLELQQSLLKKEFIANYESLYLTRYILANLPEKTPGDHQKMLDGAKLKAQSLLEILLEDKMD